MEKSSPSKFAEYKELVEQLSLVIKVNQSTAAVLEEFSYRLYALEQDNLRLLACYRSMEQKYIDLKTRYSELQYLAKSRPKV